MIVLLKKTIFTFKHIPNPSTLQGYSEESVPLLFFECTTPLIAFPGMSLAKHLHDLSSGSL